jgi:hypothetical protein
MSRDFISDPDSSEDYAYNLALKYGMDKYAAGEIANMMDNLWIHHEVPAAFCAALFNRVFSKVL